MAVTPDDLKQKLEERFTTCVQDLESKIDAYLADRGREDGEGHRIRFNNRYDDRIRNELKRIYAAAGWTVVFTFVDPAASPGEVAMEALFTPRSTLDGTLPPLWATGNSLA